MSSSSLTPFAFDDALVRVFTDENGDPWFVAKDICRALEIGKHRDALATLDEDEKGRPVIVDTLGGPQETATVSESGLYSLIFRSHKKEARRFRKWVTSEVLPAIRKAGSYALARPVEKFSSAALPVEMPMPPEEALHLPPYMRQRLWQDALQTARLDNDGSEAVLRWFTYLCRMVSKRPASVFEEVREFFNACCLKAPGQRERAGVLYKAFQNWRRDCDSPMPTMKAFGGSMGMLARSRRSNGIVYLDVSLRGHHHG